MSSIASQPHGSAEHEADPCCFLRSGRVIGLQAFAHCAVVAQGKRTAIRRFDYCTTHRQRVRVTVSVR
eukprot:14665753-Alexandrium_andersonii.AAC.1